jgi:hypothetical protein
LSQQSQYHFRIDATDVDGNSTATSDDTFQTGSELVSDTFDAGSLNTSVWTFVDPLADSTAVVSGGVLTLDVPATGDHHSVWTESDTLPRIVQPAANSDFDVTVKFDSDVLEDDQLQGLLIEESASRRIRIELHHIGGRQRIFAATLIDGAGVVKLAQPLSLSASMWLRVIRVGNEWTVQHSSNGTAFATATVFQQNLMVSSVGITSGNDIDTPMTATVDSFIANALP